MHRSSNYNYQAVDHRWNLWWRMSHWVKCVRVLRISAPYSHSFTYHGRYIVLILTVSLNTPQNNERISICKRSNKSDNAILILVIDELNAQILVLYYTYYKTRIFALSSSITKIILRCTVSKTQKNDNTRLNKIIVF